MKTKILFPFILVGIFFNIVIVHSQNKIYQYPPLIKLKEERKVIISQIKSQQDKLKKIDKDLTFLKQKGESLETARRFLSDRFFFPLLWLIFFPITIINILLYLYFYQKEIFSLHKRKIIIITLLIVICFFLPSIVQGKIIEEDLMPKAEKKEEITQKRQGVEIEKEKTIIHFNIKNLIAQMESAPSDKEIIIPKITPTRSNFPIFNKVIKDKPDYFFVLGVLFLEIGKDSKANEQFLKVLDFSFDKLRKPNPKYQLILTRLTLYWIEKGKDYLAERAIYQLLSMPVIFRELLSFATFLEKKKKSIYSKQILEKVERMALTFQEFLALSEYFYSKNQIEKSKRYLLKAYWKSISFPVMLSEVIKIANIQGFNSIRDKAINSLLRQTYLPKDLVDIAEKLSNMLLPQYATPFLEKAIRSCNKPGLLKRIAVMAEKESFYDIAVSAVNKIKKKGEYILEMDFPLPITDFPPNTLPAETGVSLPVYLSFLYEKKGEHDKALSTLEPFISKIFDTYTNFPEKISSFRLNDLYYIKEFFKRNKLDKELLRFLPLFKKAEENFFAPRMEEEKKVNNKLKAKLSALKEKENELLNQKKIAKKTIRKNKILIVFWCLRYLAILALFLFILAETAIRGYNLSLNEKEFKIFAFFWRFFESLGIAASFTIIGIIIGLPMILLAQFNLLLLKIANKKIV